MEVAKRQPVYRLILVSIIFLLLLGYTSNSLVPVSGNSNSNPVPIDIYCKELITQGNFELGLLGWQQRTSVNSQDGKPTYTTNKAFSGGMSVLLGLQEVVGVENTSAVYHGLSIPDDAVAVVLSFHYFPIREENSGNDRQFVDILNASTQQQIVRLWSQQTTMRGWAFHQIDLTSIRGQSILVEFGVFNDGYAGSTIMYLDDVSITACGPGIKFKEDTPPKNLIPFAFDTPISAPLELNLASPLSITSPTTNTQSVDPGWQKASTPFMLPIPTFTIDYPVLTAKLVPVPRIVIAEVVLDKTEINPREEIIVLMNLSNPINIDGWTLSDENSNIYHFHGVTFASQSILKIRFNQRLDDSAENLSEDQASTLFPVTIDKITLRDSTRTVIDTFIIGESIKQDW